MPYWRPKDIKTTMNHAFRRIESRRLRAARMAYAMLIDGWRSARLKIGERHIQFQILLSDPGNAKEDIVNWDRARGLNKVAQWIAAREDEMQPDNCPDRMWNIKQRVWAESLPVLHLAELITLVLGYQPDEGTLKRRRVKLEPLLAKWLRLADVQKTVAGQFDVNSLARCASCAACVKDCPVALAYESFNPNEIITMVLDGRLDEVLEKGDFWNCLDCLTCFELCPQRFGMQTVFSRLKEMAAKAGRTPETLGKVRQAFREKGKIAEGSPAARKRLGLPDLPESGEKDLRTLFGEEPK